MQCPQGGCETSCFTIDSSRAASARALQGGSRRSRRGQAASNALFLGHLPNVNNDQNKGERIQKLRQTVNVLQAHVWIGKCFPAAASSVDIMGPSTYHTIEPPKKLHSWGAPWAVGGGERGIYTAVQAFSPELDLLGGPAHACGLGDHRERRQYELRVVLLERHLDGGVEVSSSRISRPTFQ